MGLRERLFGAKVTQSATIMTTGVINVVVTAPTRSYKNILIQMTATWGGVGPYEGLITWGDGSSEQFIAPAADVTRYHTYTASGTYNIDVGVYDQTTEALGTGRASIQIAEMLTATLSASPTGGAIPLAVSFTFTMSNGHSPYTWTLDPGDGSTPYSNPTSPKAHTYNKVGTFTAILTVSDALGEATALSIRVGVGGNLCSVWMRRLYQRGGPSVRRWLESLAQRKGCSLTS